MHDGFYLFRYQFLLIRPFLCFNNFLRILSCYNRLERR
nr:MAG TPA: hypothetical protein [Caudoviricetes sp.]